MRPTKKEDPKDDLQVLEKTLRSIFPYGAPEFIKTTLEEIKLHNDKNYDYTAGAAGDPFGNFDRVSEILQLYPNFPHDSPAGYAVSLMLKQFDAFMWWMCHGHELKSEGIEKKLADISVYIKLISLMLRR